MTRHLPTNLNHPAVTAAALWIGRLLDSLASVSPPLACVMLLGQMYLGGGLRDLAAPRQWLGLIFPGAH